METFSKTFTATDQGKPVNVSNLNQVQQTPVQAATTDSNGAFSDSPVGTSVNSLSGESSLQAGGDPIQITQTEVHNYSVTDPSSGTTYNFTVTQTITYLAQGGADGGADVEVPSPDNPGFPNVPPTTTDPKPGTQPLPKPTPTPTP
jgi:hypothetical protein